MLKRFCLALVGLFAFVAATNAAGTVPGFSLTPQFDLTGKVAPGCKLYIIQAGTTSTPQNSYQDTALTQVLPNPLTCDAGGRLPQWFVADGSIKLRLTDKLGVQIFAQDNLLVVGPSSGGGGGGTVDPTTILATGDLKVSYGTGILSGFVRANGRTIGSATSGATERANADCQALFQYLWGADANLAVSGGRGVSASADWAANKTIALPDWRGRALAGLDDMGSSAAGRLTATYFGTSATALGAAGGNESKAILQGNFPNVNFTVTNPTIAVSASGTAAGGIVNFGSAIQTGVNATGTAFNVYAVGQFGQIVASASGGVVNSGGSGTPIAVASPMMLATIYMKL